MNSAKAAKTRYRCKLDTSTLYKAITELNEPETNDERLSVIDLTRNKLKTENPDVGLETEDDIFSLAFLRAKNFELKKF